MGSVENSAFLNRLKEMWMVDKLQVGEGALVQADLQEAQLKRRGHVEGLKAPIQPLPVGQEFDPQVFGRGQGSGLRLARRLHQVDSHPGIELGHLLPDQGQHAAAVGQLLVRGDIDLHGHRLGGEVHRPQVAQREQGRLFPGVQAPGLGQCS